jgi:hypothetical protein
MWIVVGIVRILADVFVSSGEPVRFAFVDFKITRFCTCTIPRISNAAMQQMHMKKVT